MSGSTGTKQSGRSASTLHPPWALASTAIASGPSCGCVAVLLLLMATTASPFGWYSLASAAIDSTCSAYGNSRRGDGGVCMCVPVCHTCMRQKYVAANAPHAHARMRAHALTFKQTLTHQHATLLTPADMCIYRHLGVSTSRTH